MVIKEPGASVWDPPGKSRPTMNDVAKLAGVCKATVSMAISNDHRISSSTRKRVQMAVEILEYRVNEKARALARFKKEKILWNSMT
jgi:LacI family kdg operon repressor